MGRRAAIVLCVLALVAVVVGVDVLFFRNEFWERLMVNVGIVLVFGALYEAPEASMSADVAALLTPKLLATPLRRESERPGARESPKSSHRPGSWWTRRDDGRHDRPIA
jgi:hypothetical protein